MSSIDARRTSSPPRKPIAAMPQENSSTTPEGEEWTAGLTCPGAEERMGGAVSSSQVQVHPLAVPAPSLTRSPSSSFPLLAGASNKRDSSFWRAPIPDVDELYLALSACDVVGEAGEGDFSALPSPPLTPPSLAPAADLSYYFPSPPIHSAPILASPAIPASPSLSASASSTNSPFSGTCPATPPTSPSRCSDAPSPLFPAAHLAAHQPPPRQSSLPSFHPASPTNAVLGNHCPPPRHTYPPPSPPHSSVPLPPPRRPSLATLASTFTRSSSASFVAGSSSCRVARLSLSSTESAKAVKQRAAAIGARGGGRGGRGMKQAVVAAPELPTFDTLSTASTAPSAAASEVSASTSSSGGRGVAAVGGGRGGRGMVKEKKMRAAKAAAPDSLKPVPAPEEPLRRPAEPKPVSAFVKKAQRKKERKAGGGRGRF